MATRVSADGSPLRFALSKQQGLLGGDGTLRQTDGVLRLHQGLPGIVGDPGRGLYDDRGIRTPINPPLTRGRDDLSCKGR